MKTIMTISLFAVAAFALVGCAPPATNTNTAANTNTNAAPKAALPTADTLLALDQKAWDAYKNRDGKYFETFLGDTVISGNGEGTMSRADVAKMISENKDEIKSFTLSEPRVTPAGADAVVLTYKATTEGTSNDKPIPSPVTVATVFVRSGTDWKAVYHNEVAVIDPAKASADATNKEAGAKPAADSNKSAAPDTNKSAASDANKAGAADSNKAAPAGNSSAGSNTNSNTAAPATDAALTDALMVIEKKGWEAWKAKDAKTLDEVTAKEFAFIDPMGKATFGKADAIKMWTTDNPCTVTSVSLSDGKAVSITKDAAILVVKGTAVGTCGDTKLEPVWATNVFVKEGDVWKSAYIFEIPTKKS